MSLKNCRVQHSYDAKIEFVRLGKKEPSQYLNYTGHIYNHLVRNHSDKYNDDLIQFRRNENNIPEITRT